VKNPKGVCWSLETDSVTRGIVPWGADDVTMRGIRRKAREGGIGPDFGHGSITTGCETSKGAKPKEVTISGLG
jgi:hypothetical protein